MWNQQDFCKLTLLFNISFSLKNKETLLNKHLIKYAFLSLTNHLCLLKEEKMGGKWIAAHTDYNKSAFQKEVSKTPFPWMLNTNGLMLPVNLAQVFQLTWNYSALWGGLGAGVIPIRHVCSGKHFSIKHLHVSSWKCFSLKTSNTTETNIPYSGFEIACFVLLKHWNVIINSEISFQRPFNLSSVQIKDLSFFAVHRVAFT